LSGVGPLVITLLVAAGQGDAADTGAMLQALVEALGDVRAAAREVEGPLGDEAMLAAERDTASDVVAAVTWAGPAKLEARVRLHVRASDRWVERGLTFAASDDLRERGRTLGFTMASMLPDRAPPPRAAQPPPAAIATPPAPPAPPPRLALDLMVMGSLGLGGNADALGGAFAVRRALAPWLSVRGELMGRTGVVQAAEATSLALHLAAGVAVSPLGNPATRRAGLEVRADLAVLYESLGHLSPDDIDRDRQARLVPGGDLVIEGSVRVLGSAAVVLGVGAEVAFGRTDVFVHERKVAELPPLRLVSSLGLRHYF
jgi:hypothetical protein